MFKFLYITDIHGWTKGYDEILQIALKEEISTIVNGGDMLPKGKDLIFSQRLFVEEYLSSYVVTLQSYGISYYGMFGNDDCRSVLPSWQEIIKENDNAFDLTDGWIGLFDGLKIRGCNYVPDPPFRLKDWSVKDTHDYVLPHQPKNPLLSTETGFAEIDDLNSFLNDRPTLQQILDNMAYETSSLENAVFVCHSPPANTGLGNIDTDIDVGSIAVHNWIEKYQPLLSLHGHIHESPEITGCHTTKLGLTTVHQPGQQIHHGKLVYSLISIDNTYVEITRKLLGKLNMWASVG
ncbi:metallophosphoesterase [Planctomycetota bacterium]